MSAGAEAVVLVRMAEMQVVKVSRQRPVVLKTTLGSCVGIILADRQNEVFGLAHVMLPEKVPDDETPGKYADSAVPALKKLLSDEDENVATQARLALDSIQREQSGKR